MQKINNNANLMRFIASLMVLWGHGYALNDTRKKEPIYRIINTIFDIPYVTGIHGLAVIFFFILSGYLITKSYVTHNDVKSFILFRVGRIYPGLYVNLGFSLLLALFITSLDIKEFLLNKQVYTYVTTNLLMLKSTAFILPGIFEDNPFHGVNGSLWTIRYELYCYVAIAFLGFIGVLSKKLLANIIYVSIFLFVILVFNSKFEYIILSFLYGAFIFNNEMEIKRIGYLKLIAFSLVVIFIFNGNYAKLWFLSLVIIWIGLYAKPIMPAYKVDISYGVYLYAFPIQQLIVSFGYGKMNIILQNFISIFIVIGLGYLSYRYIEMPANKFFRMIAKRVTK